MEKIVFQKDQRQVTAKGIHRFTLCDATSSRARRLEVQCEAVKQYRLEHMFQRNKELMPMQLRLQELNVELGQIGLKRNFDQKTKALLTEEQAFILQKIAAISGKSIQYLHKLWLDYRKFVEALEQDFKKFELVIENVTTTVGRSVLAQRLGGDTTYTGTVNYTALGSDNTAAAVGDATLGTEVYRKALSSGTDLSNVAYIETFFSATETSGTYEEYGMFIDGTGSADTGQLFNRFVTSITKSVTETLNVQSIVTFNDA